MSPQVPQEESQPQSVFVRFVCGIMGYDWIDVWPNMNQMKDHKAIDPASTVGKILEVPRGHFLVAGEPEVLPDNHREFYQDTNFRYFRVVPTEEEANECSHAMGLDEPDDYGEVDDTVFSFDDLYRFMEKNERIPMYTL